ncbi:MAG: hypothetical protein AB1767_14035, partial [Bacillota bacterium]
IGGTYTLQQQTSSLSVSHTALAFSYVKRGTYGTVQSYTISGTGLTSDVQIEAPAGFWISLSYTKSGFGKTLTIKPEGGVINQKIYVAFYPTSAKTYSGNIVHSSPGAAVNVSVSGRGY